MKHALPVEQLGPHGQPMADAVQACVHCGFCLPTCPTYQLDRLEMDSPRGRILLMKQVLEGELPLAEALPHVDACLGCLSCETACPSGVRYRDLISPFRAWAAGQRSDSLADRALRRLLLATLPFPDRFRMAASLGRLAKPLAEILPASLRSMLDLLPWELPRSEVIGESHRPAGKAKARVALLTGCAQQVLATEINRDTIEVLVRNGIEVVVPPAQGCCGALAWHVGAAGDAMASAAHNLEAFPPDVDAIVTNAAGCGSCLHEYPLILAGTEQQKRAESFAAKAVDATEFLCRLGFAPPQIANPVRLAIQDACHLLHGQGVQSAPRDLLRQIPGVTLVEIAEAELCCGSAGTYNIEHPEAAQSLGRRKLDRLMASGAQEVVTGNIGCLMQLRSASAKVAGAPEFAHIMTWLARAYRQGDCKPA